jgi:tRNA(fMet)-specific endonuclease VapC
MTLVPLGSREAELAANLRIELESRGAGIGMADYLIAGTCLSREAVLLTRDRKHFARVPGLSLGTLA